MKHTLQTLLCCLILCLSINENYAQNLNNLAPRIVNTRFTYDVVGNLKRPSLSLNGFDCSNSMFTSCDDQVVWQPENIGAGMYLYQIEAVSETGTIFTDTRKMVVVQ